MSFTTTSKFVQITPYLLMEYMYADEPTPETYFVNSGGVTVGYNKLINGYRSNTVQIFNRNSDYNTTHNTTENNVVRVGESSFVTLDSNLIVPFNDYSDELTDTIDLPITFPSNLLVIYDTVRYHIRAGYNLNNIDGLIMSIEYQDQNLEYVTGSQILIKKGTEQEYVLNPNPVTIGSNIYDKYFEFKLPNLKDMNDKYLAASVAFKPETLASLISSSGDGFIYGAPLRVTAWQVQSTVDYNGYAKYNCASIATLSLEQEDPFSNIGATIKESERGQFFEYYATDNEGFIEDFILFQNSIGNGYYISHQIEVLEQIGAALIQTSGFQSIQTTAYDLPNYYRPIVRNAAVAASFTLRYTMSLINNVNQSRITRISTYSSVNPNQWGTNITPIQLSTFPQVQKIYNRVYSQPSITVNGGTPAAPREILKYTNVFINQNYVTSTINNLTFTNNSLNINSGAEQTTAQGTGKMTIAISPFDNYYKFNFVKSGPSGDPVQLDLSASGNFNISFVDNVGNKIQVRALEDKNLANPSAGELAFKLDESISTSILQLTDRRFFITNGTSINTAQSGVVARDVVSVDAGVTSNVIEKRIESVIANRRSEAMAIKGANNYISIPSSNILTPVNNANSVMYWGYWKKQGEDDIIIGATGATAAAPIISPTSGIGPIGIVEEALPTPIIKNVRPLSPTSGTFSMGTTAANTNQALSGSALIAALSAEIAGYKATGWADRTISNYFLVPGKAGYIKYPGLTPAQFVQAARGILSPIFLIALRKRNVGLGGCPTPDMKILTSDGNYIKAGDLLVGTELYTVHEKTGEWGNYKVSYVGLMNQPILSVNIGGINLKVSDSHKFLTENNRYITISDIEIGSFIKTVDGLAKLESKQRIGDGEVVKIEVENAHTYVLEGIISHNIKSASIITGISNLPGII